MVIQAKTTPTINNVPNSLQSCAADGPLIDVKLGCFLVQPEKQNVTTKIEDCINTSGKKGQGTSSDRGIDCIVIEWLFQSFRCHLTLQKA